MNPPRTLSPVASSIDKISNEALRGNTLGAFQANIGLWEILARQERFRRGIESFMAENDRALHQNLFPTQLFDSTRTSLGELLVAARRHTERFAKPDHRAASQARVQRPPMASAVHQNWPAEFAPCSKTSIWYRSDTLFTS